MTHPKTNEDILQALARGYCAEGNTHKVVDHQLVEAMATEIESWLSTLLTTRDAERDEAVEAARREGYEQGRYDESIAFDEAMTPKDPLPREITK